MLHMLGCFHAGPRVSIDTLESGYDRYVSHLKPIDLLVTAQPIGRRCADTPMVTDEERDHQYFVLMTFRDRAQMDAAYAHIEAQHAPAVELHLQFMKQIRDPVFICWEDT